MTCQKKTLSSGLKIILSSLKSTKTVTVLVLVGTGSKYEKKTLNGVSHFLEHLFFKGTTRRPTTQSIAEELDKVGGLYNAFTGKEVTGYWVKVDSRHLTLALDVVSDMLLNSTFAPQGIEREKGVIIEEVNMYRDTPMEYVAEVFEDLLYGDQPAGWPILGVKTNIKKMTRDDIISYKDKQYAANNTVVCVAGDIPRTGTAKLIQKYFEKLHPATYDKKAGVKEYQTAAQLKMVYKKTDQTHFVLGVRAFGIKHPSKYALKLLAIILGGNMSSRLFIKIRASQALAYYIRTAAELYTDSGYLATSAGVKNDQVLKATQSILSEYRKIKAKGPSKKELNKAKEYLKGKAQIALESSNAVASFWAEQEILREKTETLEQIFKKIDKVTVRDVQFVAQNIFQDEKLNMALIGPTRNKGHILKCLRLS